MTISPLFILYFILCLIFNKLFLFLIIFLTILLHEFGHYLMIKMFNGEIRKFKLSIVGGIMEVKLKNNYYTKNYYLSNFFIAIGRNRYEFNNNYYLKNI